MRFHRYAQFDIPKEMKKLVQWGRMEWLAFMANQSSADRSVRMAAVAELIWLAKHRPFYNLYPKIARSLSNTSLDITLREVFLPGEAIAVCFAVGHEPEVPYIGIEEKYPPSKLRSVLCIEANGYAYCIMDSLVDGGDPAGSISLAAASLDEKVSGLWEYDPKGWVNSHVPDKKSWHPYRGVFSSIIGAHLLAKEEDYCERVLLSADEGKTGAAVEEKAIKRGVNGIHIGRKQEREDVSPHTRRAHFAIRWMKIDGILKPRLRPVKAAIVRRSKVTTMPTGWEGGFED